MNFIIPFIRHFISPVVILLAIFLLVGSSDKFPDYVLFLLDYAPYFFFVASALLCVQFNQSRMLFSLISLCAIYFILDKDQFSVFRLYEFILIFWVLVNISLLVILPERSVISTHSLVKLAVLVVEVIITWYFLSYQFMFTEKIFFSTNLPAPPEWINFSWLLLATVVGALLTTGIKFILQPGPIEATLLVFVFILLTLLSKESSPMLVMCLGLSVALMAFIAVIFNSHQMAYRDDLTGLRSRRALNQYLTGLGRKYTIAMIDIDHFKKFNDNHGHDIGDQMLKLVASRIAKVGGGGTPFRYGGEEFTVVFPRKELDEVRDTLEALRDAVENYPLVIRAKDRAKKSADNKDKKGNSGVKQKRSGKAETLSCTISIGIANRVKDLKTPEQVIKGADKALYRAKEKGRNCLSI